MNFTHNDVGTESPNFMNLGILAVNALDELGYFGTPNTRVGSPTDRYNWSAPVHVFGRNYIGWSERDKVRAKL